MPPRFVPHDAATVPINVVAKSDLSAWLDQQPDYQARWVRANNFAATPGECLCLPNVDGTVAQVLVGWGDASSRKRGRFHFAAANAQVPMGAYCLASGLDPADAEDAALGWLLASYQFDRYKDSVRDTPRLVAPDGIDAARIEAIAAGAFLSRDLINTPASDMGPDALESAFRALGSEFGAETNVTLGDDLLSNDLPLIHAVGRASDQAPRLLEMNWGLEGHSTVTLVGKGVCFDTGGLNLKPGASMGLMKKDMGGAATVMGLARIIMALDLPLRLRVIVPAVENSVSAGAFRPGDILTSRKGLTIEINNTDAEGRLVLADALTLADEQSPDYLFCMATLTGAARLAMGPDIVPYYTDDDQLSHALGRAGRKVADPVWRMPFWSPYEHMIEPEIADLDNAPSGGFAGSVTAALFLRRFVEKAGKFAHFDIYGWTPAAKPGRPKGAAFQAARAIFEVLNQQSNS